MKHLDKAYDLAGDSGRRQRFEREARDRGSVIARRPSSSTRRYRGELWMLEGFDDSKN